jgi:putative transposase
VLGIYISEERNMFVAEKFIRSLVEKYGKHTVYSDGGTWYPQACTFLHLKHRLHSHLEKSLIERVVQYFKDRVESFDDYYPYNSKRRDCDNGHVYNWVELFVSMYINTILAKNNPIQIINEMVVVFS